MKRNIILLSIVLLIALGVVFVTGNKKQKIESNPDSYIVDEKTENVNKEYDENGLLIVSIDTFPDLFSALDFIDEATEDSKKYFKERTGVDLEFGYYVKDEEGKIIDRKYPTTRYDILDPYVKEGDYDFLSGVNYYDEYEVGYQVDFDNSKIKEPYKLIVPEFYKEKKVVLFCAPSEDENIVEIIYPDSNKYVEVSSCPNLKKIRCGKNIRSLNITECSSFEGMDEWDYKNVKALMTTYEYSCGVKLFKAPSNVLIVTHSFNENDVIEEVSLPEGLIVIADSFRNSKNLISVNIPDSVVYIQDSFYKCEKLVLTVGKDTVGERYAIDNNIKYVYHD